jgi:two-component system nitrogen regulation sensor histidine kinase NtrY
MNVHQHPHSSTVDHGKSPSTGQRRKHTRHFILGLLFLLLVATSVEMYLYSFRTSSLISNDILVFVTINLNVILLTILIVLVGRNLLKVYFEHRSKVLGAKFRTRLITAFVGLALFPSVLLFVFASGLLTTSIDNWFNMPVEKSLQDALDIAQSYARASETNALSFGTELSQLITEQRMLLPANGHYLRNTLQKKRQEFFLDSIQVYGPNLQEIAVVFDAYVPQEILDPLMPDQLQAAFAGQTESHIVSLGSGDVIRGMVPVWSVGHDTVEGVVVVTYYLSHGLVTKLQSMRHTFAEYRQIKTLKGPVKGSYVMTFLMITLLIIFSAIWVGLQLAKSITVPIQQLAEGTRLVANGNLDFTLHIASDDEIGLLVASFNHMTQDLKHSKMALEQANEGLRATNVELDRRRSYMETVLENVAAGVIAIDSTGHVTTINKAAAGLLEIAVAEGLGRSYRQVFEASYLRPFLELIRTMHTEQRDSCQEQMQVMVKGKVLTLLVSLTFLKDSQNNTLGIVVVFDDLTALMQAQKVAAWREVARGLAHEIKNPLTPIQLSAQRLQKKFVDGTADRALVEECTTTIVQQVAGLKSLINEFSRFARMPEANPTSQDLHKLLDEVIALYSGTYSGLNLTATYDPSVPPLDLDREQLKRVFINLIDNAVEAMQGQGQIHLITRLCPARHVVQIEISDTGPGIPETYREKIFEPYFSTKRHGTGLGLSLVHRIISAHHGSIAVAQAPMAAGATFLIELPIA